MSRQDQIRKRITLLLAIFIIGLVMSGLTAFPLEWEVRTLAKLMGIADSATVQNTTGIVQWIVRVRDGLADVNARYPFIAYGTDWLAFGHIESLRLPSSALCVIPSKTSG